MAKKLMLDQTGSDIAFFVLRDASDNTFLNSTRSLAFGDLHSSRAHFETEKSALDGIKELRRRGLDVSTLEIVPISLVAQLPIKPQLLEQKHGFVIEIKDSVYRPARVRYYKGNKKKPHLETQSSYGGLYGDCAKQTITATVFDTKEQAKQRADELLAALKREANEKFDQYDAQWRHDAAKRAGEQLKQLKLTVKEV